MNYFPLFLKLADKSCLIIGGGHIALAKLETLVRYTNNIHVLSKEFHPLLVEFGQKKGVNFIQSDYDVSALNHHDLIIGATDDEDLNEQIHKDGKLLNKLVNIVDSPKKSDFIFGATVNRGGICVAISSSGASPVLSRMIKQDIEQILPNSLKSLDVFIKHNREKVKEKLKEIQPRRLFWQEVLKGPIAQEVLNGNIEKAQQTLEKKLNAQENKKIGAFYLIGAGPGDPELITLKAIKLLSKADVVLHDRLISPDLLEYARKDGLKINVGKGKGYHIYTQEKINNLIRSYVSKGLIVARLKGGDVSFFAHMYEELDAIKDLGVSYQIVPGITAASGAASYSSIALTARGYAKSVRFLTFYDAKQQDRSYWENLVQSKDTLVFYMSTSNLSLLTQQLIRYGKDPKTELAVIEQATTPFQKTSTFELEQCTDEVMTFQSPSLVIVGSTVKAAKTYQWKEEHKAGAYFNHL